MSPVKDTSYAWGPNEQRLDILSNSSFKDTCYVRGKNCANQQVLDILAHNSANVLLLICAVLALYIASILKEGDSKCIGLTPWFSPLSLMFGQIFKKMVYYAVYQNQVQRLFIFAFIGLMHS